MVVLPMTFPSVILCLTSHMTVQPLSLLSQMLEKFWLVFLLISLMMGAHLVLSKLLKIFFYSSNFLLSLFISVVPPFSSRSLLMVPFLPSQMSPHVM